MPENKEMSRVSNKKNQKKSGKRKNNQKKKKSNKSWFKKILIAVVALFIIALLSGVGLFTYYASSAPQITLENLVDNPSTVYYDSEGNEIYSSGQERELVEAGEIPQVLVDAVLSIEDQRFYNHIGIDPIRIAGAVLANVTDGFGAEGGSTITQQLIKLSVFSTKQEDQTLKRKAQEAWLAIKLEQEYSKEQILTFYINKVYMSDNQYGMGTASEHYFGKPVSELELHEAALLAGMSQAPNVYNPYTNPERAKQRRDTVLYMMYENEKISQEEMNAAQDIPVTDGLVEKQDNSADSQVIDSYLSTVIAEVREKTGLDPQTAGLKIYTNIDMDAQQQVYNVLNSDDYNIFPDDEMQTAVTVVDVNTGQLKAIGGSRKQEGQMLFNHATEIKQIGSTIKPLTTYGPAIEYLDYSTYHQVVDEPTTYESGQTINNWDRDYEGQISMRRALVDSRNVPTYKIFKDVGQENVKSFLTSVGLSDYPSLAKDNTVYEADSFSGSLSPIDLAASYAPFANGGEYTEPYTVSKVVTADGEEIDLTPSTTQAISDSTAYMITDMLKDVVDVGTTSHLVSISGVPQAGKTGTANYTSDQMAEHNIPNGAVPASAYVGYTTNYSVSVWSGYTNIFEEGHWLSDDDGTREIPRKVYREVMAHLSESVENTDWTRPSSVSEVAVEKGSNPAALPGPNTPSSEIVRELFVKGTEPKTVSSNFGEDLSAPSGLKASYDAEANEVIINWEAYSLDNSDENVAYELTIGDQKVSTGDLGYVVQNPSEGTMTIQLAVKAYGKTGPTASVNVTIPPSGEEESDENEDESESEESESSSSESSESSESSSSESSSSQSEESSSSSSESSQAQESSSSTESSQSSQPDNEDENEE
ncbi:PBP1A family penicillin-binding protein [Desemzia sp. RIT804]|uniref:PBP1A family penicillin-binding protein n=1 Tax=Desemzia sp. RIT 804 TaxID=2810209 RepID=UPI00194FCF85|nr:PBP1A family penicillin-binding protein [Desemzia sp. RIT 804]MBM6613738.1 PBP1A family penicillin-binding protein [Desemzia sp. RIT 804]